MKTMSKYSGETDLWFFSMCTKISLQSLLAQLDIQNIFCLFLIFKTFDKRWWIKTLLVYFLWLCNAGIIQVNFWKFPAFLNICQRKMVSLVKVRANYKTHSWTSTLFHPVAPLVWGLTKPAVPCKQLAVQAHRMIFPTLLTGSHVRESISVKIQSSVQDRTLTSTHLVLRWEAGWHSSHFDCEYLACISEGFSVFPRHLLPHWVSRLECHMIFVNYAETIVKIVLSQIKLKPQP